MITRKTRWKQVKNRLRQRPWLMALWRRLRHMQTRLFKPRRKRLYDFGLQHDGAGPLDKKALLSYITHPFSISRDDPRFLRHINIWHAHEMVRILNRLGYIVDVIDYRDTRFAPRKKYDLFVGHGGINFERIAQRLPNSATKLYFSTGCYWKFHNQQELARFAALRERRGVDLPPDRLIEDSEERALALADGIVGIGNDFTRKTYAAFPNVMMINGTSLFDSHYERQNKDFEKAREHFLYFAGWGNVHKGLDLLLEAFARLHQHLWICTRLDPRFAEVYADELNNRSNIHLVGWVQPRCSEFYRLMDTCNYAILPSCSEGQAHSVVECMNQGLVPVVSLAGGLDVDGYGVTIEPCTIRQLNTLVSTLSSYSPARCHEMSTEARHIAATTYSEATFRESFKAALGFFL